MSTNWLVPDVKFYVSTSGGVAKNHYVMGNIPERPTVSLRSAANASIRSRGSNFLGWHSLPAGLII